MCGSSCLRPSLPLTTSIGDCAAETAAVLLFQQVYFRTAALAVLLPGTQCHSDTQRLRDEAEADLWAQLRHLRDGGLGLRDLLDMIGEDVAGEPYRDIWQMHCEAALCTGSFGNQTLSIPTSSQSKRRRTNEILAVATPSRASREINPGLGFQQHGSFSEHLAPSVVAEQICSRDAAAFGA